VVDAADPPAESGRWDSLRGSNYSPKGPPRPIRFGAKAGSEIVQLATE
jgi:hypothetical protein